MSSYSLPAGGVLPPGMKVTPIASLKGARGKTGPRGLPGGSGQDDDVAMAARIDAPDSLSGEALTRWLNNRAFVSIRDFGAVGDGVTDDTEAIQAALDAADVVLVPAGQFVFTSLMMNRPHQSLIGWGGYGGRSQLVRLNREDGVGIRVQQEGAIIRGLGIRCTAPMNDDILDYAIHAERLPDAVDGKQRTSVDIDIQDCYISGWRTGVRHVGQGLVYSNNTSSNMRFVIDLDFPGDNWRDVGDPNQYGWQTGFRMYRMEDNRIHAIREAFVRNFGVWGGETRSVLINGLIGDVGGEIWQGPLVRALITNWEIDMSSRPWCFHLMGGSHDYTISNGKFSGRPATQPVGESLPTRFILAEGTHTDFVIRDIEIANTRQHAIVFDGPVHGGYFSDILFKNVGLDDGSWNIVRFAHDDTQAVLEGIRIRYLDADHAASAGTPIYVPNSSSVTDIKADDIRFIGGAVPSGGFISPMQGAIANRKGTGAPTGGRWKAGDIVWRANPVSGGTMGWICTSEGVPGSWTALPAVP